MSEEHDLTESFRTSAAEQFARLVGEAQGQRDEAQRSLVPYERWPAPKAVPADRDVIDAWYRVSSPKVTPRRLAILGLALVPALAFLGVSCSGASSAVEALPTLAPISTVSPIGAQPTPNVLAGAWTVQLGDVQSVITAAGQVSATKQAQLAYTLAGSVSKVNVELGQSVKAGDVLIEVEPTAGGSSSDPVTAAQTNLARARIQLTLDDAKMRQASGGATADDVARANLAIAQAQATLDADQAALDKLKTGPDASALAAARSALAVEQTKLQNLRDGPTADQRTLLQKQVDGARNSLFAAQASRDGACNKNNPDYVCTAANATVAQAQTGVDTATKQYQIATSGPSQADVQQQQAAVDAAQAKLNQLVAGPSAPDVQQAGSKVRADTLALQIAQGAAASAKGGNGNAADLDVLTSQRAIDQLAVTQAQAAVDSLQAGSTGSSGRKLVSSMDGAIVALNAHVGDFVQSGALAVVVADPSTAVLTANVADSDLAQVKSGQPAVITLAAVPDKPLTGKLATVGHVGVPQGDKVLYPVTVMPDQTAGLDLGMSARILVTTGSERGVVVVPNQYLHKDATGATVQKVVNGKPVQTPVTVGLVGASMTQVLSGLQQGDQVLLSVLSPSA